MLLSLKTLQICFLMFSISFGVLSRAARPLSLYIGLHKKPLYIYTSIKIPKIFQIFRNLLCQIVRPHIVFAGGDLQEVIFCVYVDERACAI